jgi:hypothetical protein
MLATFAVEKSNLPKTVCFAEAESRKHKFENTKSHNQPIHIEIIYLICFIIYIVYFLKLWKIRRLSGYFSRFTQHLLNLNTQNQNVKWMQLNLRSTNKWCSRKYIRQTVLGVFLIEKC